MQSEATKLLEEQATLQQGLAMAVMEQRAAIARAEAAEEGARSFDSRITRAPSW